MSILCPVVVAFLLQVSREEIVAGEVDELPCLVFLIQSGESMCPGAPDSVVVVVFKYK